MIMETCYWKLQNNEADLKAYEAAAQLVQAGEVVAFPTETVYGLGADGLNGEAVKKIFAAKGRPNDNPLILHISSLEEIAPLTTGLNANAKALAEAFWPGPLTLIVKKSAIIPDEVTAGLDTVAIRFPENLEAQAFIRACGRPIAAPSANLSGRPSPTNAQDVLEDMKGKIAGLLDGGSCTIGLESTIVDTTEAVPVILRPGGITYEMLTQVLGTVEIDKALLDSENLKPKAPGMKYRHYAPKAKMYLVEGDDSATYAALCAYAAANAKLKVGFLCSKLGEERLMGALGTIFLYCRLSGDTKQEAADILKERIKVCVWGDSCAELSEKLFYYLRDFDRYEPDVIIAEGVNEDGLGLAIMNRMRKAAGYQEIVGAMGASVSETSSSLFTMKNGKELPEFLR